MAQIAFQMKLDGADRKRIASNMAEALGAKVEYKGAPVFSYEVGRWLLTKDSALVSPPIDQQQGCTDDMVTILGALRDAGIVAGRHVLIEITGMEAKHAQNMSAVLISKANLLIHAFQTGEGSAFSVKDSVARLDFMEATLDAPSIKAYLLFAAKLTAFAEKLTRVTARERETDNLKYAFRCFLLRLGFIGDEYKVERKLLLKHLEGNGSFRSGSAPKHKQSEAQ